MVVFFIFDDVIEDGDGAFVAEFFELLAVVGDVTALFNLETTERHANAAGAVGERVGFAAGISFIDRLGAAEFDDAALPESGMLPLCARKMAEDLGAHGIGVAIGQSLIGVVALHLGLPVGFECSQNLFEPGIGEQCDSQSCLLALS